MSEAVTFLIDVDNTLLDNDAAERDYRAEIRRTVSARAATRYRQIFEELREEVGYSDYLGALQRYRIEDLYDPNLFCVSSYLLDYPFWERLYPGALEAIGFLRRLGSVAILTDGDVVFQPRKILRAGLWDAVDGKVFVSVHKEEDLVEVEKRFPAGRYVMMDDKLRILTSIKHQWGERVTTVFVRQGHYATDPKILAAYPRADITLEKIGDVVDYERFALAMSDERREEESLKGKEKRKK